MRLKAFLFFFLLFTLSSFPQTKIFIKFNKNIDADLQTINLKENIETKYLFKSANLSNKLKIIPIKKMFGQINDDLDKTFIITIPENIEKKEFIEYINNKFDLNYIRESRIYSIDFFASDSLFNEQWGLFNIRAPEAWKLIPPKINDILLAVIDTGIDFYHPDLKNKTYLNEGESGFDDQGNDKKFNGIDDDQNGFVDDFQGWDFVNKLDLFNAEIEYDFTDWDNEPFDENGHGTNISGIIAAEHNKLGIAGVLPNAKILNLRAFDKNGFGEEDDVASAIIYAVKNGAKVINMSFGDSEFSEFLKDVINYASENGVILVSSAGNNSSNLPHYPSGFNNVISVGAIQENDVLASYSNFGSSIDLVAPGSQIITTNLGNSYKKVSGTSAAATFVSAAAALLAEIYNYSPEEIKQILKTTSRDLGPLGWDEKYGAGTLNSEKALKLSIPSVISINFPWQDFSTFDDSLEINISVISPYFSKFELFYGFGYNPNSWEKILTGKEDYQQLNENIISLNISSLPDSVYTLRLLMHTSDNRTFEERTNFIIDKTPPNIIETDIFPVVLNDHITFHASIQTDDITNAKLFYKKVNSENEYKFIYLDGLNSDQKFIKKFHFGVLPYSEIDDGEYEFYFEVENLSGLKTIFNDTTNFRLKASLPNNFKSVIKKSYNLPNGRLFANLVKLGETDGLFLLLNEFSNPSELSIYKKNGSNFKKEFNLKNRIPVSIGDFNHDGKTEILSLFVKNGYIETQTEANRIEFTNVLSDSSGNFWPAHASDLDNDGKTEIIVFSSDSTITIWEVNDNLSLKKESTLHNFIKNESSEKSIFSNNKILVDDFDGDGKNEIFVTDNLGNLLSFKVNGIDSYIMDKEIDYFYSLPSITNMAKGDFNGDGILDIAILREFKENYFGAPLKYLSIISLSNNYEKLFETMFLDPSESFTSSFQKKYNALSLKNLNNTGGDELILFVYPNAYIFSYDNFYPEIVFFTTNVNTQSVYIDDIDNNGIFDFGIPNKEIYDFFEFKNNNFISSPNLVDYYSIDSNKIYLRWEQSEFPAYIFRGEDENNLKLIDSTFSTFFVDSVQNFTNYFYQIVFYNPTSKNFISEFSKLIMVYSHTPIFFENLIVVSNKIIEIKFSGKINNKNLFIQNILIDSLQRPNSIISSNENTLELIFKDPLQNGEHQIEGNNFTDFYNSPIPSFKYIFNINYTNNENEYLFISHYKICDNYSIIIRFNYDLDTLTVLDINNYEFIPKNNINRLSFNNNLRDEILIKTFYPIAFIGKEVVLRLKNILSDENTGYLPLLENSGSSLILKSNSEDLDDVFVYPNPVKIGESFNLTFANLTQKAEIYIFDINGTFIKKLDETDGDGGIEWDFKDENGKIVNSGIYLYKIYSIDNFNNRQREKIGKFVLIK